MKRRLSAFLAFALIVSLLVPAGFAAAQVQFPDLDNVDPKDRVYIEQLVEAGVISGFPDGTFRPYENVKRAQTAKIISKAMGWQPNVEAAKKFNDVANVPEEDLGWIGALVEHGVTTGYPNGGFGPYDEVTRQQLATFIIRALGLEDLAAELYEDGTIKLNFTDAASIDTAHKANVALAAELGILSGRPDGSFAPTANAYRVNAAKLASPLVDEEKRAELVEKAQSIGELRVASVTAANSVDLKVTLRGTLADKTIDKSDFEVYVNDNKVDFNAKKVSDKEFTLELIVPANDGDTIKVVGVNDLKGSATTTYKAITINKVEAVETVVYEGVEGQFLKIKADGKEVSASDLAKQGYEVSFQATDNVFKDYGTPANAKSTSDTGELLGTALTAGSSFKYKVALTKDNKVLASDYAEVRVFDKAKTAKTIKSVRLSLDDGSGGVKIYSITSNKLVVGEKAKVAEVRADLLDGRVNVDLVVAGSVEYETSDPAIASVNSSGEIEAKRAGNVTITVKSGDAKFNLNLTIVTQQRELTTISHSTGTVKFTNTATEDVRISAVAKDQYGDAWNTKNIATDVRVTEANYNGKQLTQTDVKPGTFADRGQVNIDIGVHTDGNTGNGKIEFYAGSKKLGSIEVAIASLVSTPRYVLEGNATTIDLNVAQTTNSSITFTLKEYVGDYFNGNANLTAYRVEVLAADKTVIFDGKPTGNTITISRADLLLQGTLNTSTNRTGDDIDNALNNGDISLDELVENFITGTGLIRVYDSSDNLLASKSFTIVNSTPTISSVEFVTGIEFNDSNLGKIKLNEILKAVNTTASAHDGVIRYQQLDATKNRIAIYYDKGLPNSGFSFKDGDILLGYIESVSAVGDGNIEFNVAANNEAKDVTIVKDSKLDQDNEAVQINVYKLGGASVAKTTIKYKKQ